MPKPIADMLRDRYVKHDMEVLRVQEALFRKVDKIIVALHKQLGRTLRMVDPHNGNEEARLRVLERRTERLIVKAYREVAKLMDGELQKFTEVEAAFLRKSLAESLELALEDEL